MKTYQVCILLALAGCCLGQAGLTPLPLEDAFNEETFCQNKNGNFAKPRVCNEFVQCTNGARLDIQTCPQSLHYNAPSNACDFPNQARCLEFQGDVCYGAKDSSFGTFHLKRSGKLYQLTLEHNTGFVSCDASNPSANSNWGCGVGFRSVQMGTVVTRSNDTVLFPSFLQMEDGYYFLARTDTFSRTLTLFNFAREISVSSSEELRIWHSEDLVNKDNEEENNGGTNCVRVWAIITN